MEFRQLRYFLAVAEHLHFTDAAEQLGIAQPPLSQQIRKLEREVGTPLFVRHPRRVELTEAGARLQERARRILDDAQLALAEAQNAGRGESGRLALGFAGSTVFHPQVAALLRAYRFRYPKVALVCEESNSTALLEKVREKRIDAALVRLPLDCPGLHVEILAEEPVVAALPAGHRLGGKGTIRLADLAAEPFILFPRVIGPQLHDAMVGACRAAGFEPQVSMEPPQLSSLANMVAAGFGVALVPASISRIAAEGVTYHPLADGPPASAVALVHRMREKSATVLNLVALLGSLARA